MKNAHINALLSSMLLFTHMRLFPNPNGISYDQTFSLASYHLQTKLHIFEQRIWNS